jgi:hypothetical protein
MRRIKFSHVIVARTWIREMLNHGIWLLVCAWHFSREHKTYLKLWENLKCGCFNLGLHCILKSWWKSDWNVAFEFQYEMFILLSSSSKFQTVHFFIFFFDSDPKFAKLMNLNEAWNFEVIKIIVLCQVCGNLQNLNVSSNLDISASCCSFILHYVFQFKLHLYYV